MFRKNDGARSLELTYDELGNLATAAVADGKKVSAVSYAVDGSGRRIARKLNGQFDRAFLYRDQFRPVAEIDSDGAFSHFVYTSADSAPDAILRDGVPFRVIKDYVGSVRLVVNAKTGVVAQRLDYDEFGVVLTDSNPGFQPFGFAGGLYDALTSLVRFGARDYDAETGRWVAKDPSGFAGGFNAYVYCDADPINLVDVDGREPSDYNLLFRLLGSDVHRAIAANYSAANPSSEVYSDRWLSTIVRERGGNVSALKHKRDRPDIFNATTGELYEVKLVGFDAAALAEAGYYVGALNSAAVPAILGAPTGAGTFGRVHVWFFDIDYYSTGPGVIVYERHFSPVTRPLKIVVGATAAAAASAALLKFLPLALAL